MLEVRPARPGDYDVYARLMPELGVDDPIPSRERFAAELHARTLVATDGDAVVGYALYEVLADTGYVRNIVSDPTRRRTGIGAALMAALRDLFRAHHATAWCLNVKPTNAAAIALYERFALRRAYTSCAIRIASDIAVPPPPAGIALVDAPAADDAFVEPAFGLLRGQLASSRTKSQRRVLQLRGDATTLGVAIFSPSIPGAFPFRLHDPSLAAAAIAHLRPLCPPGAPWLQLGIEDDEPLRAAVTALGGRVQLDIVHMRGAL